ncbi:Crp/Fnr family transcriptional regulator [Fluviibacterium sp. DFM31]|uniref:Crp/Fnr family transcriptional regulator n=1 Tax=Meridianimarinicoccus marinus TaxID=3231483 RepID=A0ABV3L3A3_9RHOB
MFVEFSLLKNLAPQDARAFVARLARMSTRAGTVMTNRGERPDYLYFVFKGKLTAFVASRQGREIILDRLEPGDVFGELSVLDGGSRVRSVRCETNCDLGRIPTEEFDRWLRAHPVAMREVTIALAGRMRDMSDRLFEFAFHDVETRVRHFLVRCLIQQGSLHNGAVLDPAPSHLTIANCIGANREAISRALSRLARAGVLTTGRQRIEVLDVHLLETGL